MPHFPKKVYLASSYIRFNRCRETTSNWK